MDEYDGSSYTAKAILAVTEADDATTAGEVSMASRRKGNSCVPRWAELLVDDRFRAAIAASKARLQRKGNSAHRINGLPTEEHSASTYLLLPPE